MAKREPLSVELFPYRVGFGDCFLLRFEYRDRPRHVLIDFGSTAPASKRIGYQMEEIAFHIWGVVTDGGSKPRRRLDAIVATHRHKDHLSGFAGASWSYLAALKPKLVLLPWTEHPDAAMDATAAPKIAAGTMGLASARYVGALGSMHALAGAALEELKVKGDQETLARIAAADQPPAADADGDGKDDAPPEPQDQPQDDEINPKAPFTKSATQQLAFIGDDNLSNREAVQNLLAIPTREFLSYGAKTRLTKQVLPGVTVHVLGPPTLEQSAEISRQRPTNKIEYWHLAAAATEQGVASAGAPLFPKFPGAPADQAPLEVRWFLKQLDGLRGDQLLGLVRALDDALNNTSVILLFEVCGKKLLFSGDAQWENWAYALRQPGVLGLLRGVDVYKVGHHGSLNATPKSVWNEFKKRKSVAPEGGLKTVLSTRAGKHGAAQRKTEVPRKTLLQTLEAESDLFSTQKLTRAAEFVPEQPLLLAP